METVTVDGKIYQVGMLYTDLEGEYCTLKRISCGGDGFVVSPLASTTTYVTAGLSVTADVYGTIEDAPLELEPKCWYMCESTQEDRTDRTCLFHVNGRLVDSELGGIDISDHYKPLYKMVKA